MSGRWWRAYGRARHDPKLLKLSDKDFRWWFNFVCAASDNGGKLPFIRDLAAEFRTSEQTVTVAIERLRCAGLFDIEGEPGPDVQYVPHNWNALQYVSDRSSDRVKQFRERRRNVSETPSENRVQRTETEKREEGGAPAPCASEDAEIAFAEFVKAAADCGWPKPRGLEADRRKKLKARLAEHGLDGWRKAIAIARESEFLRTKFPLKFDWVLEPKNLRKVLEGNYGQAEAASARPVPAREDDVQWRARTRGWRPGRFWNRGDWGPDPTEPGCRAPASVLSEWRSEAMQ
jgi:hypothetical protein